MPYSQVREESPPTVYDNDHLIPPPSSDTCGALPSVITPPVVTAASAPSAIVPPPAATDPPTAESDYPMAPRREIKYSGLEAAAAARKQREISAGPNARDSVKSRYSSDPCKVLGGDVLGPRDPAIQEEQEVDDMPPPNMPAPPTPMAQGGAPPSYKMRLPVDEDDYLQPKSSNPAAYMDLMEGECVFMCVCPSGPISQ